MLLGVRSNADTAVLLIAMVLHAFLLAHVASPDWARRPGWRRLATVSLILLGATGIYQLSEIWRPFYSGVPAHERHTPAWWQWMHGVILAWGFAIAGASAIAAFLRLAIRPAVDRGPANPSRRELLLTASRIVPAAPLAIAFSGAAIGRFQFELTHVKLPIRDLPPDLVGFRIAQISDPHLGVYLECKDLARMVALVNEAKPHLAAVTGDLITGPGDPLDAALAELAQLRADHGIVACHGNHEVYARAVEYATTAGRRRGIGFLRRESRPLMIGQAKLVISGVDYERMGTRYLRGAEHLVEPGAVNLLLSHNPDLYPAAARLGFQAVLAGHTHGGQVNFEILGQDLNVARFVTPYTRGLYTDQGAALYVNRGIGTVGIPVRFGSAPEVTLVELCAT